MAGKALNKNSFYGGSETGKTPDIAMPPADQPTHVASEAPDPWDNQQQTEQEHPFGQVPEELPADVEEEIEETEQEEPVAQAKPAPQDSFRTIRDAKDKAERERDALMSQILEMQARTKAQQPQPTVDPDDIDVDLDFNLDPDALVEGKDAKKLVNKIRFIEKQLKNYQSQTQSSAVEAKIRNQFPDFEKVVSQENVAILNEQYPELAASLRDTKDMYSKAASAYTVIKNFGIHKEDVYSNDRAKAVINSKKPRPLASVSPQQGDSPLSKANAFANGMTDELKEQLRREMFAARKNH